VAFGAPPLPAAQGAQVVEAAVSMFLAYFATDEQPA
jgi:hypothetical protein